MKTLKYNIGHLLYRLLENFDGEKSHLHIVTYRKAENIKIWVLINLMAD